MALKLGNLIKERYPDIKVIYTRTTDVFVELAERANIANRNNADLFICIHANAGSTTAYGSETYVLGLHRTDAQQKVDGKMPVSHSKTIKVQNTDPMTSPLMASLRCNFN